jgi:hypothetical protein
MRIGGGNRSTQRKPTLVPLCPPQIPYDLAWDRTRAVMVGSWRLTDCLPDLWHSLDCVRKLLLQLWTKKFFVGTVSLLTMWESMGKFNTHYGIARYRHIFKNTALLKQVKFLVCQSVSDHTYCMPNWPSSVSWELEAPPCGQWMTVYQLSTAAMSAWHEEKDIPWLLDC